MDHDVRRAILQPAQLWSRTQVLARPCPVPAEPGVYGWYFQRMPFDFDAAACNRSGDRVLLYVGIAPRKPAGSNLRISRQNLRRRLRTHLRGNASASTLRFTLGILLGLPLRQTGSGRLTFGEHEGTVNDWLDQNARVVWAPTTAPWLVEDELIREVDLPLNLRGNESHAFWPQLSRLRAESRRMARANQI